jgi:serine/threonine protein kinase
LACCARHTAGLESRQQLFAAALRALCLALTSAVPVPAATYREVAAKCVSLRKMSLERIEREVAITKKVAHEHVIGVYGAARRRDEYVIFLELCKEELFALVERRITLGEKECKNYMSQLLSAVNHIHG